MTGQQAAEAALQAAREARWAERHPERAASETAARKHNRAVRKSFGHAAFGTPETRYHASRTRQGALARMYLAGDLSADELAAATEIARVHERIASDVRCRTAGLETRVDRTGDHDADVFERLGQVRAEAAYSAWRRELPCAGLVLAIITQDVGVSLAARHWRMRNIRAKALLLDALHCWWRAQDQACRAIDEAALAAAHARIS